MIEFKTFKLFKPFKTSGTTGTFGTIGTTEPVRYRPIGRDRIGLLIGPYAVSNAG
jgi:hypothetical protein